MLHKKLPHLIYFALATNYFNVFMSTAVLLGLMSFEKIGGQWIFGGGSNFSNLLAPWASSSRSLMLRAVESLGMILPVKRRIWELCHCGRGHLGSILSQSGIIWG